MMGWDKQHHEESEANHHNYHNHNDCVSNNNSNVGIPYVKVMTDDQLETLRKQISVYATICEQLVEMHKNHTSHPDFPGIRLGNLYCDPLMTSAGHKITARQRWTPTPVQLQILERIFDQGNGTPSKQKIKDITSELGQHGQISETNVYNWFQNRRARSKRKQQNPSGNAESEAEPDPEPEAAEYDSPKDTKKTTRPPPPSKEESHVNSNNAGPARVAEEVCFRGVSEMSPSDLHFFDSRGSKPEPVFGSSRQVRNLAQIPFYDNSLSNPRTELLGGKMEVGGAYNLYDQADDYRLD